ncbi:AMP-binding protein [Treponema pedis]|uniref:Long-chain-fatty-acid--CoA ligase n=1 Tax=Treponema pedis str. T A4 TaxID=1291379 RepID=S5ZWY0_9SPIR|nr:AMP-binding protein [Treponema pedis]AGT44945.1 long-chain-fatty-acid--CoA ligase [Treponema pedis str. T A4]
MAQLNKKPWAFLDEFRGKNFTGEWPTLPEMFEITASRYPERNCLTVFEPDRITLSYSETLAAIKRLAHWMTENGAGKGKHIAVTGKNSPEWAVVYLASLFTGATIVPIDYGLHNEEIEVLLKTAKPILFFVDEEKFPHFEEKAKTENYTGKLFSLSRTYQDIYVYNLKPAGTPQLEKAEENDTAAILFTSGTTGNPKGVVLTHKNLVSDCYIAQSNLNIFHTDVFYALLPLHHSYTMLAVFIEALSVGAELVFGKTLAVSKMLSELKQGKITMLLGVPLLFNKLLAGIFKGIKAKGIIVFGIIRAMMGISYFIKKVFNINAGNKMFHSILDKASLSSVRIAICGGGPLAPKVFRAYNEFGIDFIQGYGLTETSPIIALNPKEHFKIKSVGQYFIGYMEMKILDPDEKGIGEVAVKGPMVMQGYYNMPEETAKVLSPDGWFRTGDLGWLDDEGYLYLCGRAKNLIVTAGGKNVFPEEIENMFQLYYNEIEQITAVGYIGTDGEEVEALVYPAEELYKKLNVTRGSKDGDSAVQAEIDKIIDGINKRLLPYQRITKTTYLTEPLEMTTTKKVKRFKK